MTVKEVNQLDKARESKYKHGKLKHGKPYNLKKLDKPGLQTKQKHMCMFSRCSQLFYGVIIMLVKDSLGFYGVLRGADKLDKARNETTTHKHEYIYIYIYKYTHT